MAYAFSAASSQRLRVDSGVVTATPLTLACWVYLPSVATNTWGFVQVGNDSAQPSSWSLGYNGTLGAVRAAVQQQGLGASSASSTASLSANTWQHAAAVFTSSTSRTAYANGGNGGTDTGSSAPVGLTALRIGSLWFATNNSETNYMDGRIAEVGVWDVALTAAEVASLAKGFTCDRVRPDNLVFYAPLVRDLIDKVGGRTITNNNTATVANHPRVYG